MGPIASVDRWGYISLAFAGELNNSFSVLLAQSQVTIQAELSWLHYVMMTMVAMAITVVIGITAVENDISYFKPVSKVTNVLFY